MDKVFVILQLFTLNKNLVHDINEKVTLLYDIIQNRYAHVWLKCV